MRKGSPILAALAAAVLPGVAWSQSQPDRTLPASQPAAYKTQMIYFGRSGKAVTVELAPTRAPMDRAALLAFGRAWAEATAIRKQGLVPEADFKVPSVRVPTVFTIAHPDWPNRIMGELVAYPDRDIEWNKGVVLRSCGAPGWFDQWAAAAGLPVKPVRLADLPDVAAGGVRADGNSLLIVGEAAAGNDLRDAVKIAKDKGLNVLVLDANWFGEAGKAVSVTPSQMLGGLSEIARQHWAQPLKFASRRRPWGGIVNRWALIADGNGLPLVEAISAVSAAGRAWTYAKEGQPDTSQPVALNCLPWQEQLGRREQADEMMLAVLRASAGQPKWLLPDVSPTVLWLEDGPPDANERPVLASLPLHYGDRADNERRVLILDLRGRRKLVEGFRDQQSALEDQFDNSRGRMTLLILGDDKMLDEWKWLKLDRVKKTIHRPEVVWLSDDELPPSKENQVRLMLKLTELGVPIAPPGEEEKKK